MSNDKIASLEMIGAKQPPPPGRYERQGCVEKELLEAKHPNFQPEKPYFIDKKKKKPDISVFDSSGKLTSLVEMKFPGDHWQAGQEEAYKKIAKQNSVTLVLMNSKSCGCK